MSKHVRKILPLLLCLLLMACLLPAAYADGVKVSTLAELQAALNNSQNCVSTGKIGGPGSGIELTVPTGVTLDITSGFVCVSSMTVNGTVNVGDNGMLMVDQSLTGSGAINVASGCKTFNLPAACYDSETHELVSLIHNNCSNVTLVHIPATYAELQSALLKAENAAEHGIGSGILIAQDLTIPQNEEVLLGNMVLSVQYGATLTLDDGAVVVTKQDVMVEQSSIRVRGGAVLAASVQLNASTIEFSDGGGFFGKRFKVRNTEDPAACIRGLDLTRAKRINEESRTIFEFDLNEPIYGGDPTVDSELALQNAITAFNQLREQDPTARIDTYTSGNFAITENITIPEGFQLRCGNDLTIAADAVVTVDGELDAIDNGYINILGKVVNYGQVRMFGSGVIHVGGTLENRSQICYENVTSDVKHLVVDKKENLQIWGPFCVYDGVSLTENVLGFPVDNWCRSIKKDEPNVSAFIPLFGIQLEDKSSSGSYSYIEVRGTEAFPLTKDMTVPAGTKVVMNSIVLTVPNGKSLTVNGELVVKALVVENGGSVTVNGYLDAVNGITLNNGGALTVNNTHIDAGYVPTTNIEALKNIVYIGDANLLLHLVVWPSDDVPNAIRTASNAVDENVNCMVELRTDWTVDEAFDAHLITLRVRKGRTLTVNNVLTVKDLVIDDGGTVITGDGGVISYADGVRVSTLAELQNALNSSQSCVSTGKIGGPGSGIELTVPTGVTLNITSGFVCVSSMTVNGTVNVGDNGMLMVDQSLTGSGAINVASGCKTFNLPAACYDSETHELVSLIHNNCSNVTLVHIPATYAELQSALLKAENAAEHGIGSGILIAQDLTIPQNEEVLLGNMVLSVQYGATLTLDDGAVVVTKQDVMVEQSSIRVRGGAVLAASVQLNASTIEFSDGGGFFGKRFKVRNTEDPAACIRGLNLTLAERIDEESRTIFEFHLNEPIYGGDPTVDSEFALQNAITAFNQQREQDPTARINVYTSGDFTITGNITIPDGFQLRCGNNLTIAAEATVTVNGKLDAIDNGYINILGKVVNYGQVRMFGSGVIHVGGTLENRSQICYENVTSDVKHLVVDKKENLQIWGPFCVYDGVSLTENVLGFPVDNWCISVPKDEPEVSLYMILDGVNVEDNSSSGRYSYIEIRGTEAYTLKKDMTVPAGTKVVMNNIVLTVPDGKSLTVNGELAVKELVVENGGELLLHENGTVAVSGKLTNNGTIGMGENAQIAVSGEFVNNRLIYLRSWNGTRQLIAIGAQGKYEEHGGFDVLTQFEYERAISAIDLSDYCRLVYVTSDNNRVTRLFPGRDLSFDPNGFKQMCENGDNVYLEIRGRDTFRFESDVTIPNVMEVVANGVELVIPAGVTVTVNGKLTTRSDAKPGVSGSAQVMGVLINNGSLSLANASDLALVNGGVYSGGGTVTRGGEPYTIWNDPANADIRLPAGLKTLESQALANGDFFSVYIPAGTTTIVSDAFGNKAGMIIYGVPGSEAETFADNNNYLFAPVAPAA